jgi:hypothetical protein
MYLLAFHAFITEFTVQEANSPVKITSESVAGRDLIPALKGWNVKQLKLGWFPDHCSQFIVIFDVMFVFNIISFAKNL